MTRPPNETERTEINGLIDSLMFKRTLVSRDFINDILTENADTFPAMRAHEQRRRLEMITAIMNQRFCLWNQTGRKPQGKVWMLNSEKQAGVYCVIC